MVLQILLTEVLECYFNWILGKDYFLTPAATQDRISRKFIYVIKITPTESFALN